MDSPKAKDWEASSGIVTSKDTGGSFYSRLKNHKALLWTGVVLIIAVGVSLYFFFTGDSSKNVPLKETQTAAVDHASSVVASYFSGSRQNKESLDNTVAKLTDLEKRSAGNAQKEAYAGAIVDLYSQTGDTKKAFEAASDAENTYQSALSAARLAALYEGEKDYANAIKYYELAAERSPKTDSTERSAYNDYMGEVQRLRTLQ